MNYSGTIKNKQGLPVVAAQYGIINVTDPSRIEGAVLVTGEDGRFAIDMSSNNQFLNVYAPGYQSTVYSQSEITKAGGIIILPKESPVKPWMVFALAGAYLAYQGVKGKKKVGALSSEDIRNIILGVGGIIGFVLLKQLLEFLGVWDSGNKKKLNQLSSDPNSFWNPNYWQKINPSGTGWTYALTEDQAKDLITQIKNSFGIINDSPEQVKAAFRSLRTKANASFLAWEFQKTDGIDLLAFLRNGGGLLPWDGLSDADILQINDYINALPNY